MSSKKRPGVAASIRLASMVDDPGLWEQIEQQYESIVRPKLLQTKLFLAATTLDEEEEKLYYYNNNSSNNNRQLMITSVKNKQELLDIVSWKFTVGKPRPQLLGLIQSNSNEKIQRYTSEGIQIATCSSDNDDENKTIKDAIDKISSNLQGVGPATASAILVRACPSQFCYMYDEVIDTFKTKRVYTLKVYVEINNECKRLANELNNVTTSTTTTKKVTTKKKSLGSSGGDGRDDDGDNENEETDGDGTDGGKGWTTARVARTLWIAARVLAADSGEDLTSSSSSSASSQKKKKNSPKTTTTNEDTTKRTAAAAIGTTGESASSRKSSKRRRM